MISSAERATIVFFPLAEPGHVIPTLPLARALRERGHRVIYANTLDLESRIRDEGFELLPVMRDIYPLGHVARLGQTPLDAQPILQRALYMREEEELFSGRLLDQLESVGPTLLLIDVILPMVAMAARARGVPVLRFSTSLSQQLGAEPPITSALPLDAPPLLRVASARTSGSMVPDHAMVYDAALEWFGFAASELSFDATFTFDIPSEPELVLAPSALEFPRAPRPSSIHIGVPVDLERREHVDPALERFVDGRPLVYVALGTQAHRYPAAKRVLETVLESLRTRDDWQAVVAAGGLRDHLAANAPSNVHVVDRAPQLWCLRRSAVFLTHAGLGAMREAIALGVPMIAIPQGFDQPGNAARIEYHGLGVALPQEVVSVERLTACITRILAARDGYVARLRQIESECADEARRELGVELVEQRLISATRTSATIASPIAPDGVERGWLWLPLDGTLGDGRALRVGEELVAGPDEVIGLGRQGFTICPDLGDALTRATGPLLCRVEVSGELARDTPYVTGARIRCLELIDATEALFQFSDRCAAHALAEERHVRPELVDYVLEGLQAYRAGIDRRNELERVMTPLFHRGYWVTLDAFYKQAHDAARFARQLLIFHRTRPHAGESIGPGTYARRRHEVAQPLDAELAELIAQQAGRRELTLPAYRDDTGSQY